MPEVEVSIVVPVFEPAPRLFETLNSIMRQTLTEIEVIVVAPRNFIEDNAKEALLDRGRPLRHVVEGTHSGAGTLLQRGIGVAKGRYISWLKPNDLFEPHKIEWQLKAIADSGADWATCDSVVADVENYAAAFDIPQNDDTVSTIMSLLRGTRDPATPLLHRHCFERAGGFDGHHHCLFELDFALRVALSCRSVHVPEILMRRGAFRETLPTRPEEMRRIVNQLFDRGMERGVFSSIAKLGAVVSAVPRSARPAKAAQVHMARAIGPRSLAFGVLGIGADGRTHTDLKATLGVPGASTVRLGAEASASEALIELYAQTASEFVAVVDPASPPNSEVFRLQLLHAAAETLDACLSFRDPLVYQLDPEVLPIVGTVFRRTALSMLSQLEVPWTEHAFWQAFSRGSKLGGLPPANGVGRPNRLQLNCLPGLEERQTHLITALVDGPWYTAVNPDVAESNEDPIEHFLKTGWVERRNPNPWFDTAWYLGRHSALVPPDTNPLEHFVLSGAAAALQPSPYFDIVWYSKHYMGAGQPSAEALLHFMTVGLAMGAIPFLPFDVSQSNANLETEEKSPFLGEKKDVVSTALTPASLSDLVDGDWYCETYGPAGVNPPGAGGHYLDRGWEQGFDPNPWFDSSWYLLQNPKARNVNPLIHFVTTGGREGGSPHPYFDLKWYAGYYLAGVESSAEVLLHFLTIGLHAGAVPCPRIATATIKKYLLATPPESRTDLIKRLLNVLAHALDEGELPLNTDTELWPLLIAEDVPDNVAPVLLLCGPATGSRQLVLAAARTLPMQEYAIFIVAGIDGTLRITSRMDESGISTTFRIPEQTEMLRTLLRKLKCERAAVVDRELFDSPAARAIRSADIPLFVNGGDA